MKTNQDKPNDKPNQQNITQIQQETQKSMATQRTSQDVRWSIKLLQDETDYIIIFGHSSFPSLLDYSKLNLANKKIQHLIIQDMYFQFLDKEIKVTFSKASLGDINPYKVLYNIYDKMINHSTQQQNARIDFAKNLEIYPQVIHYLATPISYEIFFRFNSYKYHTDDKFKEEWLRISNILSYDIYEEVQNDYEGSAQGYDIQQTSPDGQLDRYVQFQHTFKKNLFYGLTAHMKLEQIYFALESQYVPYFVIQKIFLQLDDFYRPNYNLSLQELQPLQKIVNDISMFPSVSCILFIPHNTVRKQRLTPNDKISAEKLESRSFMQIRFDQCLHCNKFIQEASKKCLEYKYKYTEMQKKEQSQGTLTELRQKALEEQYLDSLSKLKSACKSQQLQHEYFLKISFSDLFYYVHNQRGEHSGIDKRGQIQECQLRSFDIFEKVLKKFRPTEQQMRFNHEKQQITFKYQNQIDLELSILTFLSLVYHLHFIFQYYYFFSQKLTNQLLVEIKYHETYLKKDNIVMRMSLSSLPYEIQLYVEYEKQGLVVFNSHVRSNANVQQNNYSKTYVQLQNWLFRVFSMNSYMKQDHAFTYLSRGNKLINQLSRDENKSLKVISLFQDLQQINLPIFNLDLICYDDEDLTMKEMLRNQYQYQYQSLTQSINVSEDKYKKLLEINFDIDKKNQLVIYQDGSYALYSFYIDSSSYKRIQSKQQYDPKLNIFSDSTHSIIQFLQSAV